MNPFFDSIEKPTLLLNEQAVRGNIARMATKARQSGVNFRPHFKTHQSAEIGEWFRQEGVEAITVSSIDMAGYFARAGWQDITIAFPANPRQAGDLRQLAAQIHLGLLVESTETAARLSHIVANPVDIWLKIDVGAHRTGLAWDRPGEVLAVSKAVQAAPNLRLKGLLTHASQTYAGRGAEDVTRRYLDSVERIHGLRLELAKHGIGDLRVSTGDTPGSSLAPDLGPVDEIRPGNFVFYDAMQLAIGSCRLEDVGVALACPVVARHPERNEILVHGGAVHLSSDFFMQEDHRAYGLVCLPDENGWGAPLPGAYVARLSQEHGVLHVSAEDMARMQVGDLVCVLPAHSCLTVTLMKRFLTLEGRLIDTLNQ